MTSTRALMFQGTGSDVGKTVLVAGLCRAAKKRGIKVAPFKPQNMSNNAAVAAGADGEGGEIGRAQWLQALASGIEPSVHMNPVLLKPQSETGSQVIVQGKLTKSVPASEYFGLKPALLSAVLESFATIASDAELILVEGAGSPAEINLRRGDIANMGFAVAAGVPVVLVGDIDRGGVIASLVGTHAVLSAEDRTMIAGFLVNKFRGDVSLFTDGLASISAFTGWRGYGVLPFLDAVRRLPAEDSVALDRLTAAPTGGGVKIAVPVCGKIANFDDLDPLRGEPAVELVFVRKGESLPPDAVLIVLPGSKSTLADLAEFRQNGWDRQLSAHFARGGEIIGICGGFQMLGERVSDPQGVEGPPGAAPGLGLLAVETVLDGAKIVRNTRPQTAEGGILIDGYEIHMGRSTGPDCGRPMIVSDNGPDGAVSPDGRVRGCYLHGLFGSDAYRRELLARYGVASGIGSYREDVEAALDELAAEIEAHIDVDGLLALAAPCRRPVRSVRGG